MLEPGAVVGGRRRKGAWLAGLVLGCLVLHSGIWWMATGRLMADVPGFVNAAREAGWQIEAGRPERAGWPWMAAVRLDSVAATRVVGGSALRWTATAVEVRLLPTDWHALTIAVLGAQTIGVGDSAAVPLRATMTEVVVPFSGAPARFTLEDVAVRLPGVPALEMRRATGTVSALGAGFAADGITISPALQAPFDGPLAVTAAATVSVAFPDAATPGASAATWQRAGGRLVVPALELRWGSLHVIGNAEGGLDGQLQPDGQARLEVEGASEVLDALSRARLVAAGPAAAARAVVGLLALSTPHGAVPLPVSLAERTLTVAQFPVLRLPPLEWRLP